MMSGGGGGGGVGTVNMSTSLDAHTAMLLQQCCYIAVCQWTRVGGLYWHVRRLDGACRRQGHAASSNVRSESLEVTVSQNHHPLTCLLFCAGRCWRCFWAWWRRLAVQTCRCPTRTTAAMVCMGTVRPVAGRAFSPNQPTNQPLFLPNHLASLCAVLLLLLVCVIVTGTVRDLLAESTNHEVLETGYSYVSLLCRSS